MMDFWLFSETKLRTKLTQSADTLEIDVYKLFVPVNLNELVIENNDENTKIRLKIKEQIIEDFQITMNKMLNKWKKL